MSRPKKRYGQHFLHDPGKIDRIVRAIDPQPGERLVEIGPGRGAISAALLSAAGALDVIEIVAATRFYDFEAKYAPGGSKHILPAPILPFVYQEVRRLALKAHHALGCRGVTRADFRYDDRESGTQGLVCLEVNTQPGMTETSLVPELAVHAVLTFDELVRWMVDDASLNR